LQTQNTPNAKRAAGAKARWANMSAEERRAQTAKARENRWGKPKPANGNGKSVRNELASAFEQIAAMEQAKLQEQAAEFQALNDAKRALNGNGHAQSITIVDACIVVQDALQRGELEMVAHDGKAAFVHVARRRLAPGEVEAATEADGGTAYYLLTRERIA
jgi:phage major head subunit gpT-like protein